jgi:tetratricopeptide (TPR) repeat protein
MTPDEPTTTPPTLEALDLLLKRDPGSPRYAELAQRLCDVKRAEESLDVCRKGLAHHPGDAAGRRALGRALMLTGRLQEAQTELLGLIKNDRDDSAAMLLIADVLLQKADPGRAKAMLQHATKLLGKQDPEVRRLWEALGGMTGEIDLEPSGPTPNRKASDQPKGVAAPAEPAPDKPAFGPLIGGKGAIINVVDDDDGLDLGPVAVDPNAGKPAAGLAGRVAWITLLSLLLVAAGITVWRMRSRAQVVSNAVEMSRKALRTGSLTRYRKARATVQAALSRDRNNPDLYAWLAKIEARMALEYMIQIKRVPAAIFAAEKIHRKLKRHPPSALRRLQVKLGLAYRTSSWGQEVVLEAQAIQQLLTGIKPRKGSKGVRDHTVRLLDDGIRKYPKALGLRYVRGLAHLANGDARKAEQDLEETVKRDRDHVPALLAHAEVLLELGRVAEAQERFNRVLGVNPTSLRARLGMIQARLVRKREMTLVASDLQKLAPDKTTPRLIRSWYRLARAWLFWAEGKLDRSSKALEHASQSLIPEARWLSWYIRLCLLLGEVGHSRRPLVHGLASLRSADDPIVQAFKLEVKLNQGLPAPVIAGARRLLKRIGTGGPAARRIVLVLARARLAAGRYDKALKALAVLAKLKPEPADAAAVKIYGHLARGLAALAKMRQPAARKPKQTKGKGDGKGAGEGAASPTAAKAIGAARAALQKIIQGPAAPGARYALALLTPDGAQARKLLAKAVVNHRDAAMAGVLYARLLIRADKPAEGRRQVEAAMERAPAYYPALRTRAQLRLRTGHVSEALADTTTLCFAGYRAKAPAGLLHRIAHTARWSSRLSRLDRTALCPSAIIRAEDLVTRAAIYVAMEQPDAIDSSLIYLAMGERLGADPGRVGVLRALSLLSGQQTPERGKQAEGLLKALAKAHPRVEKLAEYHYAQGKALYSQNDAKAAVKAFAEALKRQPKHLRTLRSLGWLLLGAKKNAEAAVHFRKATKIAKRWEACPLRVRSQLQFALGQSLLSKGKGRDLKDAGAAFTEALQLNGQLYQAAVALAKVHLATKHLAAAHKQLEDVLQADPEYPDALLLLARLLHGKPKTRPRAQELITGLLKVCAREILSGRPEEGRFWLEQILAKIDKSHALASFMLGKLLNCYPKESKRAVDLLKRAGPVKPPRWLGPLLQKLQRQKLQQR